MPLSIVIVNWNSKQQLRNCVSSIVSALLKVGGGNELIIVDNGSTDDSLAHIDLLGVPCVIVRNPENRGFAVACNQGAAKASADFLLFLNPDTILFEDSLSIPLAFMQSPENSDVAIVGIQLMDEGNQISRSCARFPSLHIFIAQALGINRLPGLGHLNMHMESWDHGATAAVDHVIGAFYLMRRSVFEALGGFDERFFVYLEDLDLSLRARKAGWRSVYLQDARAFHACGGTSRQIRAARLFYSLRSRLLYGFKHFALYKAWILVLVTVVVEPWTRLVLALLRRSWADVGYTVQAHEMLTRELGDIVSVHASTRPGSAVVSKSQKVVVR